MSHGSTSLLMVGWAFDFLCNVRIQSRLPRWTIGSDKWSIFITVHCGVDISKELHYAVKIDNDGAVSKPFSFENNNKSFNLLHSHLSSYSREDVVGYESAAHCQDNLTYFLKGKGLKASLINPIQTSALQKVNIHNTKTNCVNVKLIAITLMQLALHIDKLNQIHDLYLLCIIRDNLMKKRSTRKIQFVAVMDRIFQN